MFVTLFGSSRTMVMTQSKKERKKGKRYLKRLKINKYMNQKKKKTPKKNQKIIPTKEILHRPECIRWRHALSNENPNLSGNLGPRVH